MRRSIPYFIPLYSIIPNLNFIIFVNVIVTLITGYLFYKIVLQFTNNKSVARIFYILLFIFPYRYTALYQPAHDIPALFFLSIFFYFLLRILNTNKLNFKFIFHGVFLGLLLYLIEIQRALGILLLLMLFVIIILLILHKNKISIKIKKIAFVSVIISFYIFSSFLFSNVIFNSSGINQIKSSSGAKILAYNIPGTSGEYYDGEELRFEYAPLFENKKELTKFAVAQYISQLNEVPLETTKMFISKTFLLTNYNFYRFINCADNPKMLKKSYFFSNSIRFHRIFIYLFSIFALFSFIRYRYKFEPFWLVIYAYLSLFFLLLIFISEVDGNYFNLTSPFVLMLSAYGIYILSVKNIKKIFTFKKIAETIKYSISPMLVLILLILVIIVANYFIPFKTLNFNDFNINKKNITTQIHDSKYKNAYYYSINNENKGISEITFEKNIDYSNINFFIEYNNNNQFDIQINDSLVFQNFSKSEKNDTIIKLIKFNSENKYNNLKINILFKDSNVNFFNIKYLYTE